MDKDEWNRYVQKVQSAYRNHFGMEKTTITDDYNGHLDFSNTTE